MTLFLNDFSLEAGNGLSADWEKIQAFGDFIDELIAIGKVSLVAPKKLWDIPLGGLNVSSKTMTDGSTIKEEYAKYAQQLYKKFVTETEGEPFFAEEQEMARTSSSMGKAASEGSPVLSITLDERYANKVLKGWLKEKDVKAVECVLNNVYFGSDSNYDFITGLTRCRQINPEKDPLWNIEITSKVLEGVDFVNQPVDKRRQMLIQYGKRVAEVNGWLYNSKISVKNTTKTQKRVVFDSARLFSRNPKHYLSIDMEGPDLCFELCDKRGNHIGEVDRNGKVSDPEEHHNLII